MSSGSEGFRTTITTDQADGTALQIEVANDQEQVVDTIDLVVASGQCVVDVENEQALTWPATGARFTIVTELADGRTYRKRMRSPPDIGAYEYAQILAEAAPPPTALTLVQSGSTVTATWNENGGPDHRRYIAYLSTSPHGDTDEDKSNDLGFSDNSLDGSEHTFIDLPIGTYTAYARLEWSDDLFEDAQTTVADLRYLDASLAVDVEAPVVTPPVLSCSATSATFVVNNGNSVAYGGGPYEVKMDWTDDQGGYAGTAPVTGLQASVGVIAYVTQEGAHPTNVYSWTLPSTGPAVDVNFTYGENPAKDPSVQCTATAVISIPASGGSGFVPPPPPGVQPTSSLQGFGAESTFARDLVNGAAVVPVTNFNQSGAGSLRGALQERNDRRYIIPLVSGTLTANDTMYCAGRFAMLGAAAKFAVRTLPSNGYVTFLLNAPHQLVRYMTLMSGQASFAGEQARKPIQSYSHTHVVDHCTLLFGVDDVAAVYGLSKSDNTTWSYNMMAFGLIRSHQGTYNSGKIMIIGSGDCSFHHNLLYSGSYRGPQISNEFTDSRNNISLAAGAILIAEVHAEHNVYANAVNNIDLSGNTIDQQACRHGVYVTSPSTPKIRKAYGYLSGNVNAAGNPLPVTYNRGDANAMNYNVILNSPVTLSPQTGRSVPAVTTHSTAELEAHLYPQVGSYLAGRSDVENDVISRMQNRTVAHYDAVAGDSLYPQTFAGNTAVYARKYPKWPTIPFTGINPAFDVTQIDCVPAAWKVSKGLAANADTTKIDLLGDGIPAFEVFYEEVTGCPPF
jgi:hypothetical protein